nr:MAG TPA: hypothetical protein [Caudoviricetes sp.]
MTESDRLDIQRRAEDQRARRRAYNDDMNLSEGIVKAAGVVAVGMAGAALLSRTGISPAIERGLTFSSRFSRGTHGSSKALEDWTITEYKQLSESAEKAFSAARKDLDTVYLDPHDNRSLFGHLSTIRSLIDSSGHIENEFFRQEQIIKPTVDWFRSKNKTIQNIGGENTALKIEDFIRNVSHNPFDRSLVYSAQKDIGALTDKRLKRTTDAIVRHVQKLDDNLKNKTRSKRRTQIGLSNVKDVVMNIESLEEHYGTVRTKKNDFFGKFMKFIRGNDRAITVGDIIKNPGDFKNIAYQTNRKGKPLNRSPIDDLIDFANTGRKKNGQNWYDRFLDLTPDSSLRISHTGRMYSSEGRKKFIDALTSSAANTLPGKILKMRDINYSRIAPKFSYWMQGASDPVLAALTNKDKNKKTLDSSLFRVYDKYYRLEENGKIIDLGDLGGTHLYSGRHGATQHLIHQMSGDTRYKSSSSSIFRALDLFQDRSEFSGISPLKKINAMFGKSEDPNYIRNIINDLTDTSPEKLQEFLAKASAEDSGYALEYLDKVKRLKSFLESTTYEINRDTAKAFSEVTDKDEAKIFFKTLAEGSTKDLEQLLLNTGDIHNDSLVRIANHLRTQHEETIGAIRQSISRTRENIGSSIKNTIATGYDKETLTYQQILRKEMSKEAFLRMAYETDTGLADYGKILNAIKSTELPMRDYSEAKRLADKAIFEDSAKTFSTGTADNSSLTDKELYDEIFSIRNALTGTSKESQSLRSSLEDIKSEQLNWQTTHYNEPDEIGNPAEYNIWSTIRNTTTPLDIIRSLNDQEKFKSTTKHFFRQFYAGRNNLDDVSEMTLAPYFMLSRLSDEMNVLGLGFSKDSMGSTWDMTKAIALKRILPIAVGSTYLEWADDTSQEITGTSISSAAAQGIANVDLAARKTLNAIGATDWLKGEKSLNPIMQYWGDHNEFMDYEERKEWYASGYEPVRKGAWWTFGGVNEARGGEITYWQPNIVRRIQSDYLDKSLYDGYFDKWSHSLLPTPSNPLSPIFGILDPYWLEEKHKDDRPYLLTGEMFANGTPWGAILNPTIGEIIKSQKDLHTFLGFEYRNINGVDPLSLMHAINLEIKQKARDLSHTNYIQVKGDQYTPTSIKQFNAPTEDSLSESVQFKDGQVIRYERGVYGIYTPNEELNSSVGVVPTGDKKSLQALFSVGKGDLPSIREAIDYKIFGGPTPYQENVVLTNKKDEITIVNTNGVPAMEHARSLFIKDRMEIDRQINGDFDGAKKDIATFIEKFDPRRAINILNSVTKEKASSKAFNKDDFDEAEGILSAQKLKSYKPTNAMDLLNSSEAVTELINAGKGSDAVRDAAISWRLVSGIYGYAFGAATGFGVDDKKIIATGQDITSFSRTFWDANFGGAGGGVMEIARRFIPDYRRGTRINPLLNEMPDWLPDRYRYGDAFSSIPKGEMRLPGKGYESLNELHPDQFGDKYGAFDRMKILADIAPFTPEYRMWRDIAKKTVTDPELIQEMEEIRDRVSQQGKKHDFYDYKLVGRGLDYKNVVVSEILDYGKFRSGNTIFKIAGASVKGNAQESMQNVLGRYIHVGEKITVAVDENETYRKNNDSIESISAAVFAGGENIGLQMIQNGDATKRKGDTSAAALLANYGPVQKGIAYASEVFAHLDVPWLSDQFLRVRSPIESYRAEQIYGTPYQSWEHPINSFLMPAVERAFHDRTAFTGLIGTATRMLGDIPGITPGQKHALKATWLLSDRGAFIGAALSKMLSDKSGNAMKWARHGSAIATLGHFITGGNSYFDETTSGANLGQEIARIFKKNRGKGAVIGAAVGALYRAAYGDSGEWVPERTKRKWELQDYFDRLTYIKYMGLYHQAAKKAEEEEGVEIEDIFKRREELAEKNNLAIDYFKKLKKQLQRNAPESDARNELISGLNKRIEALDTDKIVVQAGEWTRTAVIYKQAADATMVGLKKNSTWSQLVSALPTNDREYFMEFVKERDNDRRNEILKTSSPFLRKALMLAWGKTLPKSLQIENEEFFKYHELPKKNWAGWAPQYDLKDIEVKTIENEGMMLADFGYYDSQLRDPKVRNAPTTNFSHTSKSHNINALKENLKDALQGNGLKDVDISITPGPSGGFTSIVATIKHMLGMRTLQRQVDESLSMQASM